MAFDNFGGEAEPAPRVPLPSPLRWVIAAGLGLILCAAAFVGGWLTGRTAPTTGGWIGGMPAAPAPADWTTWTYPNATEKGQTTTGDTNFGNARVGSVQVAHLVTPDSFEQVMAHYAATLNQMSLGTPASPGNGTGVRYVTGGAEYFAFVDTPATRPGVKGRRVTYRTSKYALVIDVTRADAEKQTTIAVSYLPIP
jgi:hypothetical protein